MNNVSVNGTGSHRGPLVCHVLHSLSVGGAEVLTARLARRLRDRCRFHFVCLDELGPLGEQLREDGFPVEVLQRRPGLDARCAWRLARILGREGVNVVHAHQYTPFFYALMARLCGSRRPVLFTEHGRHQPDYPRRKRILANRLLLGRRDRVVAVGGAVRRALIVNEGLPSERIEVVYNGIDADCFAPRPAERDAVRRELGLAPQVMVMIQVARLDYLKDHITAVRALARVVVQLPATRLILVGDGPERLSIQREVERFGLTDNVMFLGTRQDVARLLQGADLFLLTSVSEGIPLTVIEAMATGLPAVCTRVGGMPEIVEEGETGLLAPAKDDDALAAAVLHMARKPELRARMGQHGQQRARESFSETRMAARYLALYGDMAST